MLKKMPVYFMLKSAMIEITMKSVPRGTIFKNHRLLLLASQRLGVLKVQTIAYCTALYLGDPPLNLNEVSQVIECFEVGHGDSRFFFGARSAKQVSANYCEK